jgi:hypothetical protein
MKLRNKKTSDIIDVCIIVNHKEYRSIEELYEDYEDYKPAEPLIKDEKVRKAVRAWAEALKIKACKYDAFLKAFCFGKSMVCFKGEYYFSELTDEKYYDIAELCGEEE